jgi:hypothetical protein
MTLYWARIYATERLAQGGFIEFIRWTIQTARPLTLCFYPATIPLSEPIDACCQAKTSSRQCILQAKRKVRTAKPS